MLDFKFCREKVLNRFFEKYAQSDIKKVSKRLIRFEIGYGFVNDEDPFYSSLLDILEDLSVPPNKIYAGRPIIEILGNFCNIILRIPIGSVATPVIYNFAVVFDCDGDPVLAASRLPDRLCPNYPK